MQAAPNNRESLIILAPAVCALHTYISRNTYRIENSIFSMWFNGSQVNTVRTVARSYSGWRRSCGLVTGRVRDLSLLQAELETHSASYSISIRGLSSSVQMVRLKTCQLPPSSAKVKNTWSNNSIPTYAFMACTQTTLTVYYHSDLWMLRID
jgi:hypothetical protein